MTTDTTSQPHQATDSSSASPTTADSTTEQSSTAPVQATPNQPAEDPTQKEPSPENREAAKYRVRLREAEAERDATAQRLESITTHIVEEKLKHLGVGVKALKAAGVDLTSVYDETGQFDDSRLLQAVQATHETLGLAPDHTLNKLTSSYHRTGRVDWTDHATRGVVPTAGTGGERSFTTGWDSIISSGN
ncbi:hypothetical protein [Nesterenkonia jeotgali]|uniref:Uncharacterized protein n=1 Tax=Nesterenkonia jeotgali TaxID=317018 RepID=A0A839FKT4_9MICC|nr:hypothetical protein [Nesterenkonia jeotgali]MBA8920069.1 hypothetical protein [Nesterenkonia jeotgali]